MKKIFPKVFTQKFTVSSVIGCVISCFIGDAFVNGILIPFFKFPAMIETAFAIMFAIYFIFEILFAFLNCIDVIKIENYN